METVSLPLSVYMLMRRTTEDQEEEETVRL